MIRHSSPLTIVRRSLLLLVVIVCSYSCLSEHGPPGVSTGHDVGPPPIRQDRDLTPGDLHHLNRGCTSCHENVDQPTMHQAEFVVITCVECHGGDGTVLRPDAIPNQRPYTQEYMALMERAHVSPRSRSPWHRDDGSYSSANPPRTYTALNEEDPAFIRFINPGDLRVADRACGGCHGDIVHKVRKSMMTHGAQLWGAALYNNGSYPHKTPHFGESYGLVGETPEDARSVPQALFTVPPPDESLKAQGVLDSVFPLPRWEVTQPGNILRPFERGGRVPRDELQIGVFGSPARTPGVLSLKGRTGRPDVSLTNRGIGTQLATDPVFFGLQKTRLLDPLLSFMGTNDHAGDYRHSGCTACHTVYANDSSRVHSGPYAIHGNRGHTNTADPTIPRGEPGHPLTHSLTRAIPSSQCIVCHIHPGTSFANGYLGFTWWDNETDGDWLYPREQRDLSLDEMVEGLQSNPEGSSLRGLWSNLHPDAANRHGWKAPEDFLESLALYKERDGVREETHVNDEMKHTQLADFHGHGWLFRAIFKKDRKGYLLDAKGERVPEENKTARHLREAVEYLRAPEDENPVSEDIEGENGQAACEGKEGVPVHLKDIHLERGMHCVDCHFEQDVHGNGLLYGSARDAVEIECVDCHGTVAKAVRASQIRPTGPASAALGPRDYTTSRTSFGEPRFYRRLVRIPNDQGEDIEHEELWQRSAVVQGREWKVPQVRHSVDRSLPDFNEKAAYAKLVQKLGEDGEPKWDDIDSSCLAHRSDNMTCYTCHNSWMTSCFGCHLSTRTNRWGSMLHNEGATTRSFTSYNYQVLRDDVLMLGKDATVKKGRIAPIRSSSAVIVSSQNANREWLFSQQQTISTEGYSGQAFNPHFPHTVRKTETRTCTDCHLSEDNDNNAWMAQLLLHGTNFVNFLGRYVYVAQGEAGFAAVVSTEREEPQAVLGSDLHEIAYPEEWKKHVANRRQLTEAYTHGGNILDLQMRGEYLYTARGADGFYVYDIATIDNKGFSQRTVTSRVSPLGQDLAVATPFATAVASPTTLGVDPTRKTVMVNGKAINQEQPIHPLYAYIYVSDLHEGLVLIGAGTLLDGDPTNNFLEKSLAFNPDGRLNGARHLTVVGQHVYVCCNRGLVVVDISTPLEPRILYEIGSPVLDKPSAVAVQFRYAFVCDEEGLKIFDVTFPEKTAPRLVSEVSLAEANRVYVARTYAYVAAGSLGVAVIDVENPEKPFIDQYLTENGAISDARDVKVGMVNASLYAYIADGENGFHIVQLSSPKDTPTYAGFSPRPQHPRLIATYPTDAPALAVSKGLDRDRAVDESGNQLAVFGRIGARPYKLQEQRRHYEKRDAPGELYRVRDEVPKR